MEVGIVQQHVVMVDINSSDEEKILECGSAPAIRIVSYSNGD
ncbi:hypothetical protein DERF_002470 [Dermatophagoides farinae]|uniref:Uncharacterized protein n=1 Tax=Dermatophagoides farinae TaxID=6954 RepID=A0A922IBQ3_DERFA|nr:hypothetical protein DERF_002470 [Dermatophagoides farinae]